MRYNGISCVFGHNRIASCARAAMPTLLPRNTSLRAAAGPKVDRLPRKLRFDLLGVAVYEECLRLVGLFRLLLSWEVIQAAPMRYRVVP